MAKESIVTAVALALSPPEDSAEQHAYIVAGLANGVLRPVIDAELPLSEAARAHREVIESSHHGKIVLITP